MARKSGVAMARQSQQVLRSASSSSQPSFQFFPNPGFFNPHRTISAAHSISFHLQTLLQFPPSLPKPSLSPTPTPFLALRYSNFCYCCRRASNIVVIQSEDEFSSVISQARGNFVSCVFSGFRNCFVLRKLVIFSHKLSDLYIKFHIEGAVPALFYFSAVWCEPCKFISPIIGELSEQYPHVTTYKVDIDEKCLTNTLDELNISSVPTFQFFKDGKTVAEVVGANVAHLRNTLKNASRISEDD
ncbi:unnamed protein product [Malus baccata var. baccata]